jgi:nucleoside 2-deoxyribosyltransferase
MEIKKVFIASPSFNPAETKTTEEIGRALKEEGFETFNSETYSKYLELMHSLQAIEHYNFEEAHKLARNLIFYYDIYEACEVCDATVLNLEGRIPDEESVSLAALAFRSGKPVVIYKNDSRAQFLGNDSPILLGMMGFEVISDIRKIPVKLRELENQKVSSYNSAIRIARRIGRAYQEERSDEEDFRALAKIGARYFGKK